jgi:hypothetical protein
MGSNVRGASALLSRFIPCPMMLRVPAKGATLFAKRDDSKRSFVPSGGRSSIAGSRDNGHWRHPSELRHAQEFWRQLREGSLSSHEPDPADKIACAMGRVRDFDPPKYIVGIPEAQYMRCHREQLLTSRRSSPPVAMPSSK